MRTSRCVRHFHGKMKRGRFAMAKVTPELESRLAAAAPGQELDLILEMSGNVPMSPSGRASGEYVDSMRQAFDGDVASVHRLVGHIGGIVVGQNWSNRV